jgi:UDP-glucose 4-epimerase
MGNNLINVDLTGGAGYGGSIKVVKVNNNNYTLVNDVNVYNLLNNGTLETVTAIRLYSSNSIQIDCTNSLPNTITTFRHFTLTNYSNVKNIENIFNNLYENCSVYID